ECVDARSVTEAEEQTLALSNSELLAERRRLRPEASVGPACRVQKNWANVIRVRHFDQVTELRRRHEHELRFHEFVGRAALRYGVQLIQPQCETLDESTSRRELLVLVVFV